MKENDYLTLMVPDERRWRHISARADDPAARPVGLRVTIDPSSSTVGQVTHLLVAWLSSMFPKDLKPQPYTFQIDPVGDTGDDPVMGRQCFICPTWADFDHLCIVSVWVRSGDYESQTYVCSFCATMVAIDEEARRAGGDATGNGEGLRGRGGESS